MSKALVIVESPAKARTIGAFLDQKNYVVESSIGHVRDLPSKKTELPDAYQKEPWAYLGIDVDNGFKPVYVSRGRAQEQVRHLKSVIKNGNFDTLYLATDEDREGEAIAWHVLEVLKPAMGSSGIDVKRMVFHEITPDAIEAAIAEPRELNMRLVDAQEARRCFDRLYGYEISPVLWRKVRRGLSAGRVQSVANRLIVQRERERLAFVSAGFFSMSVDLAPHGDDAVPFAATLRQIDAKRVAVADDFNDKGELDVAAKSSAKKAGKKSGDGSAEVVVLDEATATAIADAVPGEAFTVTSRQSRPYRSSPQAPFITSSLQRAASSALGFAASRTMAAAQRLYEAGRITYMRTDSVTLSAQAIDVARKVAIANFGKDNVPAKARAYKGKARNAQEAHEAIRPAGDDWAPRGSVNDLGADASALYDLIYERTVACQMIDATGETITIRLAGSAAGHDLELSTGGTVLTSPGYRLVAQSRQRGAAAKRGADGPTGEASADDAADEATESTERQMPDIGEGDTCVATSASATGRETNPPRRYTEASLVAKLEELGIGRPSTYASILSTIVERGYITKRGSSLVPEWVAMVTVGMMERHYASLVDFELTARMEDDLDSIAAGDREMQRWLADFYFGPDGDWPGLRSVVSDDYLEQIDAREINGIPLGVDDKGRAIEVRAGRTGAYVRRDDDQTRSVPTELAPDELTMDVAVELFDKPNERVVGVDPDTGLDVVARIGRFGPFVSIGRPNDEALEGKKPKSASLLPGWDLATVSLEEALSVLSLPRVVGRHPDDDGEITAQDGRYGPYISWAKTGSDDKGEPLKADTRSLESHDQMFNITLDQAVDLLAQPKARRARQTAAKRELGTDPNSEKKIVVRDGRFGPYVTDGETNASLRGTHEPETVTLEAAIELLAARRAAGPAKKKPKKPAQKGAKRPAAKRPAKGASSKRPAAKK